MGASCQAAHIAQINAAMHYDTLPSQSFRCMDCVIYIDELHNETSPFDCTNKSNFPCGRFARGCVLFLGRSFHNASYKEGEIS